MIFENLNLKKLKEVIISATEPLDHNIDYLIDFMQFDGSDEEKITNLKSF